MNIPYVYLIGWTKHDTWYCGVRFAKNCCPSDLWTTYFTSSNKVKQFRQENGEPDHIEIVKEFDNSKDAREFEEQKLLEFDVLKKKNWLNQNIRGKYFGRSGPHSEETKKKLREKRKLQIFSDADKKKMSLSHLGIKLTDNAKRKISLTIKGKPRKSPKPFSIEHRKKMSESRLGEKNHFYGKFHSEKTKIKIKEARSKQTITHSEETRNKISKAQKGKKLTEEHKIKLKEGWAIRRNRLEKLNEV